MKDYCRISDFNNTTDNNGTCGVDEAPSFGHFGVSDIGPDVAVSKLLLTGRKKYKAFLAIPVKEGLIFEETDSGLKQITDQTNDWQPLALALALAGLLLLSVIGIAAWRKSKGQRRRARPDYRHGGTASTCDNSHVEALDEGVCQEVLDAPFVPPDVTSAVMQPPEYDSVTQPAETGPINQPTESGVTQPAVHGPILQAAEGGPVVQPTESGSIMQSAVHGSIMQQAELGSIIQPAEYGTIMQPVDNGASVQPEH